MKDLDRRLQELKEALLQIYGRNLFRKHGGVHAAFGEHLVKTGEIDARFHRYLLDAFESGLEADYGVDMVPNEEAATEIIWRAKEFLTEARSYLSAEKSKGAIS